VKRVLRSYEVYQILYEGRAYSHPFDHVLKSPS